jgi:hypothetical protein
MNWKLTAPLCTLAALMFGLLYVATPRQEIRSTVLEIVVGAVSIVLVSWAVMELPSEWVEAVVNRFGPHVVGYVAVLTIALSATLFAMKTQVLTADARLKSPGPADILDALNRPESRQPSYEVLRITRELENELLAAGELPENDITTNEKKLIGKLNEMKDQHSNDPQAIAAATYGLLLCARHAGSSNSVSPSAKRESWDRVAAIAAPWEGDNLANINYVFAIHVYGAEAVGHRQSINDGIEKYQSLERGAGTPFLSPIDFTLVDPKTFVTSRLQDLKTRIWIYDSKDDGDRSKSAEDAFISHGLLQTVARGKWDQNYNYFEPYIYYSQKPSDKTLDRVKELVCAQIRGRGVYHKCQDGKPTIGFVPQACQNAGWDEVRNVCKTNSGLDLLIMLPLSGEEAKQVNRIARKKG